MEGEAFNPSPAFGNISDCAMELDLMDELLYEGCWLETTDAFNLVGSSPSASGFFNDTSSYLPFDTHQVSYASIQHNLPEESEADFYEYPPSTGITPNDSWQPESSKVNTTRWIGPKSNPGPSSSVKQRLMQAVSHLKEGMKDKNVLIQIWVPVKKGKRNVLTTSNQPFSLDPACESLEIYRHVSEAYQFPADEDLKESVGLPGRVFCNKVPEWTPDVRFFKSEEYQRVDHAQKYDVRGSLALPVFERGSGACLGVVEIVTTSQKSNYRMELESVCKALEAVNLRSSQGFSAPAVKDCNQSFQAVIPNLLEVITYMCKAYELPLALTWASCIQQGKEGCRHSSENYALCVSTVDSACFVANQQFMDFREACSEHHLLKGQGIVGKAFTTSKPCYATDITAFTKTEYPPSHYARMFGLCCAIAVPLVSIYTGSADFVLEFFLPTDCKDVEEQIQLLNILCMVGHQGYQISPAATVKKLENATEGLSSSFTSKSSSGKTSQVATMMEDKKGSKEVFVSLDCQKELKKEELQFITDWDSTQTELQHGLYSPETLQVQQNFELKPNVGGNNDTFSFIRHSSIGSKKLAQKRRAKTEKTIGLQVLQQYFAGSLKDAAKSIGVCPTTLKRICRQHGITRWPSRKIKKVCHSLRKLQLVIDSVQGPQGTLHLSTFYNSFPELSCPEALGSGAVSSSKPSDPSTQQNPNSENEIFISRAITKSASSSYSQGSSSTTCSSFGSKQKPTLANATAYEDKLSFDHSHGGELKRTRSDTEMHVSSTQEEPKPLARSLSHKLFDEHARIRLSSSVRNIQGRSVYRVKATFGEEKIRFSMQPGWGYSDLRSEVAERFNINDASKMDLKYLDDDREWVLLTCDADLEECIDVYKASRGQTIRISVHHV